MTFENGRLKALSEDAERAAQKISEHVEKQSYIRIITHFDADGLSAGGLMTKALMRMGGIFSVRAERWIDPKLMKEKLSTKAPLTIFLDFGSGYMDLIKGLGETEVIILDHHQTSEDPPENLIQVNPHIHGIDGAREISGAGVTYLTAKAMDEDNRDLAYLGVIGALADLQDKYDDRSLGGVNEMIVKDATETGSLTTEIDLLFFGRETRPIHKALSSTIDPFIPGISGEEDKSLAFLLNIEIKPKEGERWRALRDLTKEEKRRLFSELASLLVSEGYTKDKAMGLIGTVYILNREEPWTPLRDAREFASLLNATGRMDRSGLGISLCAGDRGASLRAAVNVLQEYKRSITSYMNWIREDESRLQELESYYLLHGKDFISERMIGTISNILFSTLQKRFKPLVAYAVIKDEGVAKISARGTGETLKIGINLGEILREAAERLSGLGGGHDVAAGAQVEVGHLKDFLDLVSDLIKRRAKND